MDIYLDTSVISALFDDRNPERQEITKEFFDSASANHTVYISALTVAEIENTPDMDLQEKMKSAVKEYSAIPVEDEAEFLANEYIKYGAISGNHEVDAYHIAIAVLNRIPNLLSWNYRHMVRRKTKDIVNMTNTLHGYSHVDIITPGELL